MLCRTGDGLGHVYVRLNVAGQSLTDIDALSSFTHLRYVVGWRGSMRISAADPSPFLAT